jgi:hypothetical protein
VRGGTQSVDRLAFGPAVHGLVADAHHDDRKVNVATPAKKPTTKKASAKAPKKAAANGRSPRRRPPTREAIEKRAYELSLEDASGDAVSHWLQAEQELKGS